VLPLALYVLSYLPWMQQGHPLGELWPHTKGIWRYHAGLVATHPYFSKWYTWPWLYRPTWYYWRQSGETISGIVAIGNPILWWSSVAAAGWALVAAARERSARLAFCGAGFCCLYLPWGLSPRTLNYSHYLFEAIPYACLAVGVLLDRHWDGPQRALARGYAILVALAFVYFLPLLMGLPMPARWFYFDFGGGVRPWTWFATWI
jgi:dolichyl-phosphate-mannose--protein O-mannosyl transferase